MGAVVADVRNGATAVRHVLALVAQTLATGPRCGTGAISSIATDICV